MNKNNSAVPHINPQFQKLILPLQPDAVSVIMEQLMVENLKPTIVLWKNIIIDGYELYQLCSEQNTPYVVKNLDVIYQEEVIAWICQKQLARSDLPSEMRKYLIGVQYNAVYLLKARNKVNFSGVALAKTQGEMHGISYGTVKKYSEYARSVDSLRVKWPDLVEHLLKGNLFLSQEKVNILSKTDPDNLQNCLRSMNPSFVSESKEEVSTNKNTQSHSVHLSAVPLTSIKDMPPFDPDASIAGLALTIPSWISSIERVRNENNFSNTSPHARIRLINALSDLQQITSTMLLTIQEVD